MSKSFKASGVVSFLALQLLAGATAAMAAPATTGGPPKSMMISLASWATGASDLVSKLNYICTNHRDPSKPGLIQNLVLTDIAKADEDASPLETTPTANDVLATDRIAAILPYFPGGKGPCTFDNVFVGTVNLDNAKPAGKGDDWLTYRDAMRVPEWRTNSLQRTLKVAQAFQAYVGQSANPKVQYHWYISHEAQLEFFTDPAVQQGYESYMIQQIKDLSSVVPNRAFIWSPSFQQRWSQVSDSEKTVLAKNLKTFFSNVQSGVRPYNSYQANAGGPIWLHLQDMIGSTAPSWPPEKRMTREDAGNWYFFLKDLFAFTSLGMNVEQFTRPNWTTMVAADPAELMSREAYYQQRKIDLGAAFELRYWAVNNHQ